MSVEYDEFGDPQVAGLGMDGNGSHPPITAVPDLPTQLQMQTSPIVVETWRQFADASHAEIPFLVEGLWPEGALGFIASPPKMGKTWVALALGLSVALGRDFLDGFAVKTPRPVLYIALEGHRSAIMHRIAALQRGLDHDPDNELDLFHIAYKPRGINIADPVWAEHVLEAALRVNAGLVIIDVLRAAARIKENDASEFADMRANLEPIMHHNISIGLLHHFTKLSEITSQRTPAERMSGTGAMNGAMDIGIFITGSDAGARNLRLDFGGRDVSTPPSCGVYLEGIGSGVNGGFTYNDRAWWRPSQAPSQESLTAPPDEIVAWLIEEARDVPGPEIEEHFNISSDTLARRRRSLQEAGVSWRKINRTNHYRASPEIGQDEL